MGMSFLAACPGYGKTGIMPSNAEFMAFPLLLSFAARLHLYDDTTNGHAYAHRHDHVDHIAGPPVLPADVSAWPIACFPLPPVMSGAPLAPIARALS